MKRTILTFCLISIALISYSQNKKAEKDSIALVKFAKAYVALDSKDFVIIVDSYETGQGIFETNNDDANFLSHEKELIFVQGQIIAGNGHTNKLTVSEYNKTADKKGNINIRMQVLGSFINGRIEIFLRKGGNNADVIITPTSGSVKRFSGEVVPRAESKYFKRSGGI